MDIINGKVDYIMKQCECKDFKSINDWIDENILCKKAGVEEIKELICAIETELNNSAFYTIVAICYALFIGAVALIPEEIEFAVFGILTLGAFCLMLYSVKKKKEIKQKTFLLKVLYFKLEELNKDEKKRVKDEMCDQPLVK